MKSCTPGLGVALTNCYFCGKGDRIVLNKVITPKLAAKVESMNGKVLDMEPCSKCRDYMEKGILFLTIDSSKCDAGWNRRPANLDEKKDWMPNPYRAGGFTVIKESACEKILNPDTFKWAAKTRFMFIEHSEAEKLGFFQTSEKETA